MQRCLTALCAAVILVPGFASDNAHAQPSPDDLCERNVVVTGYWPPTNEMLRQFSTNPAQNPGGWQGQNWHGHGFDIYAYFPEFPPDGNPNNAPRGSDGYVGSPESDFRVDYQDTSPDFWRIMDDRRPLNLDPTSRGNGADWEIEAVEGGHGGSASPHNDWSSDHHGPQTHPTSDSIEPRSWNAISIYRNGNTLDSTLPMDEILAETRALGIASVEIDHGTSGNYLSGFMGLHGIYYNQTYDHNLAAGHIHVRSGVTTDVAVLLIEATLDAVLGQFDATELECSRTRPIPSMHKDDNAVLETAAESTVEVTTP